MRRVRTRHEPEFRVTVDVHGNINDSLPQPVEQPTVSEYPQRRDAWYVQSTRVRLSFLAWFPTSLRLPSKLY
jgi:hypothetical protein